MGNAFEKPEFTATGMGNVPYKEIAAAVNAVLENFPEAPCLPVTSRTRSDELVKAIFRDVAIIPLGTKHTQSVLFLEVGGRM